MKLSFKAKTNESYLTNNIEGLFSILYESNNGAIVVPHDMEAMLSLSKDTLWGHLGEDGVYDERAFQKEFEVFNKRTPLVVYLLSNKDGVHKFVYGFDSCMEVSDEDWNCCYLGRHEAGGVNSLYAEAVQNSSPEMVPYIKACAHSNDWADYQDNLEKTVQLERGDSSSELSQLSSIGAAVIQGIKDKDYLESDMFGTNVVDMSAENPEITRHYFGAPALQIDKEFLLAADKVFDYSFKPLNYIDPNYMGAGVYCDIALMLIAQNTHNIENVDPIAFDNLNFVTGLLNIASIEQPANQQMILRHVHRIPILYGHVSGDFEKMKEQVNLQIKKELPSLDGQSLT